LLICFESWVVGVGREPAAGPRFLPVAEPAFPSPYNNPRRFGGKFFLRPDNWERPLPSASLPLKPNFILSPPASEPSERDELVEQGESFSSPPRLGKPPEERFPET
jgi:hypothetical protein